jgi:hypothetical protein
MQASERTSHTRTAQWRWSQSLAAPRAQQRTCSHNRLGRIRSHWHPPAQRVKPADNSSTSNQLELCARDLHHNKPNHGHRPGPPRCNSFDRARLLPHTGTAIRRHTLRMPIAKSAHRRTSWKRADPSLLAFRSRSRLQTSCSGGVSWNCKLQSDSRKAKFFVAQNCGMDSNPSCQSHLRQR